MFIMGKNKMKIFLSISKKFHFLYMLVFIRFPEPEKAGKNVRSNGHCWTFLKV